MTFFRTLTVIVTAVSMSAGLKAADFGTVVDVGQYSLIVSPYAYKALGGATRSSWGRMSISNAAGAAVMIGSVWGLKHIVDSKRPDGSDGKSFPSGHTAWAYLGASVIDYEACWRSRLYPLGAYALASAIGVQRVLSHRHRPTDVVAGAAIGMCAARVGYFLHDLVAYRSLPRLGELPENGSVGVSLSSSLLFPLNPPSLIGYKGASSAEMLTSADVDVPVNSRVSVGGGVGLRMRAITSLGETPVADVEKRIVPRVTVAYSRQLGNYFRLGLKADAGVAVAVSDFAGEMMSRRISPRGGIGASLDFFSSECATTGVVVGYDLTSVKYTFGHSTPVDVSKMVSSIEIGFRTLWRF